MFKSKEKAMREEARAAIIETLKNGYAGYYRDLHSEVFNTNCYIIGPEQARKALKEYDVFEAIKKIQTYEQKNFGKIYTDLGDPEQIVNMLYYIIGEEVLYEIMKDIEAWEENWYNLADEETNAKILQAIEEKIQQEKQEKRKMLEKPLEKAMAKVDEEMDRRGYIDDSDGKLFCRFFNRLKCFDLVANELVPDLGDELYHEKREEIEYLADELLNMVKEEMKKKYNTYSNNGKRCYYKDREDLIYWAYDNFMPAIEYLDEQYEYFVNEFRDIEISIEEYAKLIWELEPDDLEDYL